MYALNKCKPTLIRFQGVDGIIGQRGDEGKRGPPVSKNYNVMF